MPWSKFLKAHRDAIAAADFFTAEVWTPVGLVRYLVFFVLDAATRPLEIAGIAPAQTGLWMSQVARNLIDELDGFLRGKRYLITTGIRCCSDRFHDLSLPEPRGESAARNGSTRWARDPPQRIHLYPRGSTNSHFGPGARESRASRVASFAPSSSASATYQAS